MGPTPRSTVSTSRVWSDVVGSSSTRGRLLGGRMTFVGRLVFEDESASGPDAASLDFLVSGLLALADIPLLDSRPWLDIMACDLLNHHHSYCR